MKLGDVLLESTDIDIGAFIVHCLNNNNSKLSKFLAKEFVKKKVRVNSKKFKETGKIILAYGKKNVWWLVDPKIIDIKTVGELLRDKPVDVEYVLPVCNRKWTIVAEKKK